MRVLFGVVSVLVVLAVVGLLASKQMKALTTAAPSGVAASGAKPVDVRVQSQQLQQKVRDDMNRALEQGAARQQEADK